MPIMISQLRDHSISVDQDSHDTFVVEKYLDTATVKENLKSHINTLPYDTIFTKEYAFTSDKQVEVIYR